jgi:hypothetical protein
MDSSMTSQMLSRKMYGTPPATASTVEPRCCTSEKFYSPAGSLNSTLMSEWS